VYADPDGGHPSRDATPMASIDEHFSKAVPSSAITTGDNRNSRRRRRA
jgi:hypothetical protein